jgi:hypothetical protein
VLPATPSLLNNYLRSFLHRDNARFVLDTILLFLKHPLLSGSWPTFVPVTFAEKRMLSLLYMLKHFMMQVHFGKE